MFKQLTVNLMILDEIQGIADIGEDIKGNWLRISMDNPTLDRKRKKDTRWPQVPDPKENADAGERQGWLIATVNVTYKPKK